MRAAYQMLRQVRHYSSTQYEAFTCLVCLCQVSCCCTGPLHLLLWSSRPAASACSSLPPLHQVVGFHSGYHAMMVFATNGKAVANGKRLAQVAGIRLSLHDLVARPDNEPGQVFMQLDGEPWVQKVPAGNGDNCVVVRQGGHCVASAANIAGVLAAATTRPSGNMRVCQQPFASMPAVWRLRRTGLSWEVCADPSSEGSA